MHTPIGLIQIKKYLDIARLYEQSGAQARQISGLDYSVQAIRSEPQSKQPKFGQSTS